MVDRKQREEWIIKAQACPGNHHHQFPEFSKKSQLLGAKHLSHKAVGDISYSRHGSFSQTSDLSHCTLLPTAIALIHQDFVLVCSGMVMIRDCTPTEETKLLWELSKQLMKDRAGDTGL